MNKVVWKFFSQYLLHFKKRRGDYCNSYQVSFQGVTADPNMICNFQSDILPWVSVGSYPVTSMGKRPTPSGETTDKIAYEVSVYTLGFWQLPLCT